ncbi:hypothetical protein H310_08999 [Aphanomyces invadans]|uniref:Uncharacterized protein n=1 Tax=Aphanomyces invadans TaxID=157072 RepID=A0A024TY54_9STRA|nr:hypothetical protein H310_08999 [Aphanomyces invadans]ETV98287.1 hypothetical protein H310_08999 [Aphanomyces invadans]|eukprot:XP_008873162.1 hypothetical protein H310_08999 [Aphanomyces invadans]
MANLPTCVVLVKDSSDLRHPGVDDNGRRVFGKGRAFRRDGSGFRRRVLGLASPFVDVVDHEQKSFFQHRLLLQHRQFPLVHLTPCVGTNRILLGLQVLHCRPFEFVVRFRDDDVEFVLGRGLGCGPGQAMGPSPRRRLRLHVAVKSKLQHFGTQCVDLACLRRHFHIGVTQLGQEKLALLGHVVQRCGHLELSLAHGGVGWSWGSSGRWTNGGCCVVARRPATKSQQHEGRLVARGDLRLDLLQRVDGFAIDCQQSVAGKDRLGCFRRSNVPRM